MKRYYYTADFNYLGKVLTISSYVSDKYEDMRDHELRYAASTDMTYTLREHGIYTNRCIHSKDLRRVKKSEAVSLQNTLEQIEQAKKDFENMPSSGEKMLIAMATMNGYDV